MSLKTELSALRKSRLEIGTEILKTMDQHGEFPLPDMYKVVDKMMQYFYEMGFEDKLNEEGSVWLPTNNHWRQNFKLLRELLRYEDKFFEYVKIKGGRGFIGDWAFRAKKEYARKLEDDHGDISTRTETYNNRLDDSPDKWKIKLPSIKPVPALT